MKRLLVLIQDWRAFRAFDAAKKPAPTVKDLIASMAQVALLAVGCLLVSFSLANQSDTASVDGNEPKNAPSFDSAVHRQAASQVCKAETGRAGLVRAHNGVVAAHVMVVRLDGVMERMDTTEAWERLESANEADDIWVVGVCKSDVIERGTVKA